MARYVVGHPLPVIVAHIIDDSICQELMHQCSTLLENEVCTKIVFLVMQAMTTPAVPTDWTATLDYAYRAIIKFSVNFDVDVDTSLPEYKSLRRSILSGAYAPEVMAAMSLLYYYMCLGGDRGSALQQQALPCTVGMNYCRLALGHISPSRVPGSKALALRAPSAATLVRFLWASVAGSYCYARADLVVKGAVDACGFLLTPEAAANVNSGSGDAVASAPSSSDLVAAPQRGTFSLPAWCQTCLLYLSYAQLAWAHLAGLHHEAVNRVLVRPLWTVLTPRAIAPGGIEGAAPTVRVNRALLQRQLTMLIDLYRIACFYYAYRRLRTTSSLPTGGVSYNPAFRALGLHLLSPPAQGLLQRLPSMDAVGLLLSVKLVAAGVALVVRYAQELRRGHLRAVDRVGSGSGSSSYSIRAHTPVSTSTAISGSDEAATSVSRSISARCHICMDGLVDEACPTATPCGHLYCWVCIVQWCSGASTSNGVGLQLASVAQKHHCPMCRAPVSLHQLRRLYNY